MSGMPPTVGFNMPLGSPEVALGSLGNSIKGVSGLAAAKKKAAKKAAKLKADTSKATTGERTFIPLTQNRSLPVRPGAQPRPVVRNGGDAKASGGTGKFESNPAYGKWKKDTRKFKGNMSEQGFIQNETSPGIGHQTFTNDLFPDERVPGKQVRNSPFNLSTPKNVGARQSEANKIQATINRVNNRNLSAQQAKRK